MKFYGVYLLWRDPLIISCFGNGYEEEALYNIKEPANVLFHPTWLWTPRCLPWFFKTYIKKWSCKKTPHYICSSKEELKLLNLIRLPRELASISIYINERKFNIATEEKKYDAIYAARMVDYKRLDLAAKIPSLYVQTYGDVKNDKGEYDLPRFAPELSHCDYNKSFVTQEEVIMRFNQAKVGLALSACEGAMLAAVEYMLCGLALVSTKARGGREEFFDERFVKVVENSKTAVANAVEELIKEKIDPQFIREETLKKLKTHRLRFCKYIQTIIAKTKKAPEVSELYDQLFNNEEGIGAHYVHRHKLEEAGLSVHKKPKKS